MVYTFNGVDRIITINDNTFNILDLYSKWKEWVISSDNAKFMPAFLYHSGDLLEIVNGWKIKVSI
jgi:hypothetical protein